MEKDEKEIIRVENGLSFNVIRFSMEMPSEDLRKLQELGFVLKTAKLIPDIGGPKADVVCIQNC